MKRILLLMALAVGLSTVGYAQKANVNKAKNKALTTENPDISGAKNLIEDALMDDETKNLANTWFVAGLVYERSVELGTEADVAKAFEYYLKAYELDQMPNAKGKVAPKFDKKIANSIGKFYRNNILFNYAITLHNRQDYRDAVRVYDMLASVPDLPFMANEKAPIVKDEVFYQSRYYAALAEYLDGNIPRSAEIYEEIKDQGYEENRIYQYLYDIYKNANDTTNYVRILETGMQRFPDDFFYLGNLINYFVFSGQKDKGLLYLEEAIAREPNNAQYYYVKGTIKEEEGNAIEAAQMFEKAIELNKEAADYWIARGRLYYNHAIQLESESLSTLDNKFADDIMLNAKYDFKHSLTYFENGAELTHQAYYNLTTLLSLFYPFQI